MTDTTEREYSIIEYGLDSDSVIHSEASFGFTRQIEWPFLAVNDVIRCKQTAVTSLIGRVSPNPKRVSHS